MGCSAVVEGKSTHPLPLTLGLGGVESHTYIHTYIHTGRQTLPRKIPHTRPDIVVWDKVSLTCTIIDISVPLDLNISSKIKDKQNNYMLLMGELQMLYPTFKYKIVPVVIGAFGTVTTQLKQHLQSLGFGAPKCEEITRSIQKRALMGSMKICKTILKM